MYRSLIEELIASYKDALCGADDSVAANSATSSEVKKRDCPPSIENESATSPISIARHRGQPGLPVY